MIIPNHVIQFEAVDFLSVASDPRRGHHGRHVLPADNDDDDDDNDGFGVVVGFHRMAMVESGLDFALLFAAAAASLELDDIVALVHCNHHPLENMV